MNEKKFTVVMRGRSAAIIRPRMRLDISVPTPTGKVVVRVCTRWLQPKEDVELPGNLWLEINGPGVDLASALKIFPHAAIGVLPMLSLVANAAIHEPDVELAFDSSPDGERREYFQQFLPPETDIFNIYRFLDAEAASAFIEITKDHSEGKRISRAANQYRLALEQWRLGRESHCVAHLYMAAEALTKAVIRKECAARGFGGDPTQLASELGISLSKLDGFIKREFIFNGDEQTYRKAKRVSDGYEHGFLDYGEMRSLARDVRKETARLVRTFILRFAGLSDSHYQNITNHAAVDPVGYWPVAKYIRATLVGKGEVLAQSGNAYPFLRWNSAIESAKLDENGQLRVTPKENVTAELAEGISFTNLSLEAWKPD